MNKLWWRSCPNCGRQLDEYEPYCGPDGLGCVYCVTSCPNCGNEVYETDIRYINSRACCQFCEERVREEETLNEDFADDEEDEDDDDLFGGNNLTKEELEQRMKKQKERLKDAKAKLRKTNIDFLKATAKANGEPMPENLDDLSDEELNDKVKPLMEKFMKENFSDFRFK